MNVNVLFIFCVTVITSPKKIDLMLERKEKMNSMLDGKGRIIFYERCKLEGAIKVR